MKSISIYVILIVSVFVLNITFLLVSVGILWSSSKDGQPKELCEQLCLPCRYQDSTDLCCNCRIESLQKFLKMVFQHSFEEKKEKKRDSIHKALFELKPRRVPIRSMNRPVVRLSGSKQPYDNQGEKSELVTLKSWKIGRQCYMNNGIIFRNGRIVVPINGTYHVYSLINILKMSNESMDTKYTIGIYKFNILTMKEQLLCERFLLRSRSKDGFYSVDTFVSLDVNLDTNDEIYVKVTNTKFIRNPSLNTFGLYML